jgi:hypothetical protein
MEFQIVEEGDRRRTRMFRLHLIILVARFLKVPIRIADEFWVGPSSYEPSANRSQSSGHAE